MIIDTTKFVPYSREHFAHVVGCYCSDSPEIIARIVDTCLAEHAAARNKSVWHCASIVYGTLDRCQCWPCTNARAARS